MTKLKTIRLMLLAISTVLMFTQCSKDKDPVPIVQSTASTNGNANINSFTFSPTANDWFSGGGTGYAVFIPWWTGIDSNVVNNGVVMVYYHHGLGEPNTWIPLPETSNFHNTRTNYGIYGGSGVSVTVESLDGTMLPDPTNSPISYIETIRIVVISSASIKMNPNINWANYSEVKEVFGLQN